MQSFTKTALNAYKARALAKTFGLQTEGPAWKWALRQLRKGRTPEQITGALNQKERRLLRRRSRRTKGEHALTLGKDRNVQTGYVKGEKYQVEPKPPTSSTIATGHAHPKSNSVHFQDQNTTLKSLARQYKKAISDIPSISSLNKSDFKSEGGRKDWIRRMDRDRAKASLKSGLYDQSREYFANPVTRRVAPSVTDYETAFRNARINNAAGTIVTPGSPIYSTYKRRIGKFKEQGSMRTIFFRELPKTKS